MLAWFLLQPFCEATISAMVTEVDAMHSFSLGMSLALPARALSPRTHQDVSESLAHGLPRETPYKDNAS